MQNPRERLLELVRDGATVSGAARALEIPRATVYSWKSRDPAFSLALVDALGRPRLAAVAAERMPSRDELLGLLAARAREGNVRAIELLLREPEGQQLADDPIWRRLMAVPDPEAS